METVNEQVTQHLTYYAGHNSCVSGGSVVFTMFSLLYLLCLIPPSVFHPLAFAFLPWSLPGSFSNPN